MFADADKHANAVKAWNNLRPCTSLDLTAIREYGWQLVTLFSDMGPDPAQKPITEKGAIDFYITGLPEAARGVIAVDRMANAAKYERLDSAVTQTTAAIQGAYPQLVPLARGRPADRASTSGTRSGRDFSAGSQPPPTHKRLKGGKGGAVPPTPKPRVPDEVVLRDPKLRAYRSKGHDGKNFSMQLRQILRRKNLCIGCRSPDHRIANCPAVPAVVRNDWASRVGGDAMETEN